MNPVDVPVTEDEMDHDLGIAEPFGVTQQHGEIQRAIARAQVEEHV